MAAEQVRLAADRGLIRAPRHRGRARGLARGAVVWGRERRGGWLAQCPDCRVQVVPALVPVAGPASAAAARRGEGLLAGGPSARVSFQALASPAEHFLCTSDPAEIARIQAGQPAGTAPAWPAPAGDAAQAGEDDLLP